MPGRAGCHRGQPEGLWPWVLDRVRDPPITGRRLVMSALAQEIAGLALVQGARDSEPALLRRVRLAEFECSVDLAVMLHILFPTNAFKVRGVLRKACRRVQARDSFGMEPKPSVVCDHCAVVKLREREAQAVAANRPTTEFADPL